MSSGTRALKANIVQHGVTASCPVERDAAVHVSLLHLRSPMAYYHLALDKLLLWMKDDG